MDTGERRKVLLVGQHVEFLQGAPGELSLCYLMGFITLAEGVNGSRGFSETESAGNPSPWAGCFLGKAQTRERGRDSGHHLLSVVLSTRPLFFLVSPVHIFLPPGNSIRREGRRGSKMDHIGHCRSL